MDPERRTPTVERKAMPLRLIVLAVAALGLASPAEAFFQPGAEPGREALAGRNSRRGDQGLREEAHRAREAASTQPASGIPHHRPKVVSSVLDDGHVLQEADGAQSSHPGYRRYHYGYGPLAVTDTNGKRFIQTDALGSPTDLTSTAGAIASMRRYDAWGSYRDATAPTDDDEKLGYTGHQYDPETGLVYARARYYDPELGRFISRDTFEGWLEDAPSLHRYVYAQGNPLRYRDENGDSATAVGAIAGFFWGFGQMVGGMAQDVWDGRVRDTTDYLAVWGQNIVGGAEIGASIDLTLASGGTFALAGGGALASAGFDALTFTGEAQSAKDFAIGQVVEGGKGAVFGAGFGLAMKGASAVVSAATPLAEAVSSTAGAQMVKRGAQAAIGKLAQTEAGQAVAAAASAAKTKLTSAGGAIARGVRAMGAQADDVARQVGLGRAAEAPAAAGRWLAQKEGEFGQFLAQSWREASLSTGGQAAPVGTPIYESRLAYVGDEARASSPLAAPSPITDPRRLLSPPRESNPWAGNTASESVGPEGRYAYRVHGEGDGRGAWLSDIEPPDEAYVRGPLAVLPAWNEATHVSRIALAPGSRIQTGLAGSQGPGFGGGGGQIRVLNRSDIAREVVEWTRPLPRRR